MLDRQLKERWKANKEKIKASGVTKAHIQRKIKVSKTSIYCYCSTRKGLPLYPQYVTEEMTAKIEGFFSNELPYGQGHA